MIPILTLLAVMNSQAVLLDCTYSMMSVWNMGSIYTCTGKLFLFGDPRSIIEVGGEHKTAKSNANVLQVSIRDKKVKIIPQHLGAYFPNLESLDMMNSGVEDVSRADFMGLPKLKQLCLQGNEVKVLDNDLFAANPVLVYISFYNNPINHIGHGVFDNLKELTNIELHGNSNTCLSSYAYNRPATLALITKIQINCPPTFEMTVEKLKGTFLALSSQNSTQGIAKHIETQIKNIEVDTLHMKQVMNQHENRIVKLENVEKLRPKWFK